MAVNHRQFLFAVRRGVSVQKLSQKYNVPPKIVKERIVVALARERDRVCAALESGD